MRKTQVLTALLFLIASFNIHAQLSSLKGTVTDSVEKKNPENAVISLLRQSDSVLVKFTRADKNGAFVLSGLTAEKYILLITHPYMGDYFDSFELPENTTKNLGQIFMIPKSKLLAEVFLKTGAPIRIKGDTTVYTADSFKVRAGANVEELLRRLPGIQVDKDGKITAMGERVKKVLVDGEEFFGSDPGIATKNLRADAVKEVEVFDKKSDQAEFTGIDDGVKDKTINLKMKKKDGYFGKVEVAGGLPDKYNNAIMLNSFKNKRKLAGYGIMSNTGQTNLDWEDAQNYGGGMSGLESGVSDDGGIYISYNGDDDNNFWGGRNGIPQNWNGGLHYSDKFGKEQKQSLNAGYKYSKINAPAISSTFSRIFLPDSSWISNSKSNNFNSTEKHAFNLTLELAIDSANSIKWTNRLNKKNVQTSSNYYSEALTDNADNINNSQRNNTNSGNNNAVNSSILWRHKFRKLSRTLSVNADLDWSNSLNNGYLNSLNKYYDIGQFTYADTIDQQNIRNNEAAGINTKIAFTEPLAKDFYLEISHSIAYNHNSSDRITNIKNNNGKYEYRIDSLSNSFAFDRLVNRPGINFKMNKKKYSYSFGAAVGFSNFIQRNLTDKSTTKYNFINFFPQASYTYKFKPNENLRFNYNGSTVAPSLEQLQPIRVNTDPLNIYSGNALLKQAFSHTINMGYNFYNVLKEKNLYSNIYSTFVQHAFVQSSVIDSVGKRTYQTVNADGVYYFNVYTNYGFKILKGLRFGFGPAVNINRNIDFINSIKNITTTKSIGIRLDISKYVDKKINFYFSPSFNWIKSLATINTSANADYWQIRGWANLDLTLPENFSLSTDANTEIRQKDPRFTQQNNFTTWNASLTKRFLKDNKLEIKIGLYDILNQRRGYDRNFNSYSFTESYYTTLRRFWLLTLTWNISKNGKPASF